MGGNDCDSSGGVGGRKKCYNTILITGEKYEKVNFCSGGICLPTIGTVLAGESTCV